MKTLAVTAKTIIRLSIAAAILVACSETAMANSTPVAPIFGGAGWTMFADSPEGTSPGGGGQAFDAEYFFYKLEGNNLSIGLQSGFDLLDGHQKYTDGRNYYAGDLALSFDGNNNSYEYAFDFGFLTKDYHGGDPVGPNSGQQTAGLYDVDVWNNDVAYDSSAPFAVQAGTLIQPVLGPDGNIGGQVGNSYYRIVTLDLTVLGLTSPFTLDAHWTMSCGNDVIEGTADIAPVPEPATMLLFGTGLMGIAGISRRKIKNRA